MYFITRERSLKKKDEINMRTVFLGLTQTTCLKSGNIFKGLQRSPFGPGSIRTNVGF